MNKVKDYILFCPGPVNVAPNIIQAMTNHIGHRETEFSELLERVNAKLLDLYEIRNKSKYQPLIITGSGTAANETILSSVVGTKKILIISNGEFGERLYGISKVHNKHTHTIAFKWAEEIDLVKVEQYIQKHNIDIIAMVHHETSTGMLNPVAEVGKLAKKYNTQFFIDTVSSAAVDKIDLEKWNVTFCSTSSGKAICSLPGLGIIMAEKKALDALKDITPRIVYLNLYKLYQFSYTKLQTPNTPAVHLFHALDQALSNILTEGVSKKRQMVQERAFLLRKGMKELGFEFLLDEPLMSSVLTTVKLPKHIPGDYLRDRLKEKRIIIYSGKGVLLNKVFQIANIGELNQKDLAYLLSSLEEICFLGRKEHTPQSGFRRFVSFSQMLHLPHKSIKS